MEYCFTTNFDLLEIIKLLSPWFLAVAVYWIWHKQKEKEVIANESKDLLKIIDELNSSYSMIFVQHHLYMNSNKHFDEDYYQKAKEKYNETEEVFNFKIKFLLTLVQDKKISQVYERFKLNQAKFTATQLLFENQDDLDFLQELNLRLGDELDQLKLKLVGYAMYKNKIKVPKII